MRYSSGGTGYGGVVLGIHHAQNVIYYACPCPLRDAQVGKPGHARFNCVKGECGVGNTPRTGHGIPVVTLIPLSSWLHIPKSTDSVHSTVRQSLTFSWDPCHPMTIPGPRCGLSLQSAYVPPDCFFTAYGAMVV